MDELLLARIEKLEKNVEKLQDNNSVNSERLTRIEGKVDELSRNVERLTKQIDDLLSQPKQRWDIVSAASITAIVSAAVAFFVGKII